MAPDIGSSAGHLRDTGIVRSAVEASHLRLPNDDPEIFSGNARIPVSTLFPMERPMATIIGTDAGETLIGVESE
jgi:hypothetical protein